MDKYIVREARVATNYPQGNQMIAYPTNVDRNNLLPNETNYYGGGPYTNQFPNMQHVPNPSYVDAGKMNQSVYGPNMHSAQNQMVTGIDPRYLASYSDNSAQYIITGQAPQSEPAHIMFNDTSFGSNYQGRSFTPVDKNKHKGFKQAINHGIGMPRSITAQTMIYDGGQNTSFEPKHVEGRELLQNSLKGIPRSGHAQTVIYDDGQNAQFHPKQKEIREHNILSSMKGPTKVAETKFTKKENQNLIVSRAERIQTLHKSGPRAFSGPVEKVLKWHKALQDIGIFVFYEIVAKCVSVRPGESCAKNLVIRDENGPAMQVVYYEIDFLLPKFKVPSTVRAIGRILPGTGRLHAFSVRPATGDDVGTLPRRAAVAAHHVARLCKEYGINA